MKKIKILLNQAKDLLRKITLRSVARAFISGGIISLLLLQTIYIQRDYQAYKVNDIVVEEIKSLEKVHKDKYDKKGEQKIVLNFDLYEDTLPFANFGTVVSPGGNCEGYNVYEMLYFNNELEDFLDSNKKTTYEGKLGEYKFNINDMKLVYKEGLYYFDYEDSENKKEKDYKKIVKDSYSLNYKDKTEKLKEDFTSKDFESKETKNILEDIMYIQNNKGYMSYRTLPYNSANPGEKLKEIKTKYDSANIGIIIDSIDDNKLLPIGIANQISGHSLLAYSYEIIDDSNVKIYVKDSNIPIIHKDNLTDDDIRVNKEIESNCYILFTKDILKDDWSYIYQPVINGRELYGYFNSFVPGTILSIIQM